MSCVTLHIPTVAASTLSYSLATFLWQQLLPNAVSCNIRALTGSWAVTVESLLLRKARLPWSPTLLSLLRGAGRALAPAAAASSHLRCAASRGIGSRCHIPALGVTGQETGETFLPNWAMLAARQPRLLWGKGCGLDGSLQQAGLDVPSHPRLDLFRLYLPSLAQTLEWIQDPLCPHGLSLALSVIVSDCSSKRKSKWGYAGYFRDSIS